MGAAISAIELWIAVGSRLSSALRSLWNSVASLFRTACDFFQGLIRNVKAHIFYERETVWSNRNQGGRSRLSANLSLNAVQDQREPVKEIHSKEELLSKISQGRRCFDELENIVLANPTHENLPEIEARLERLQSETQNFVGDAINAALN